MADKEEVKKGYNYPDEIRDATIVEKYSESTFSIQAIEDFGDQLDFCMKNHDEIIKNWNASGGIIEKGQDEKGEDVEGSYIFYIGNTAFFIQFDTNWRIIDMSVKWDMITNYKTRNYDIDMRMILQTATAHFYHSNPQMAKDWLVSKKDDVWNLDMVRGLQKRADMITSNEMVAAFFYAGANIETLEKFNVGLAKKPGEPTTAKKTEYGDI